MSHVLYSSMEVIKNAGLTYRQIDHWERTGAIWLEHPADGSGTRRHFTPDEANDLIVLGRIVRKARGAGFQTEGKAIADIWATLRAGKSWQLVLSVHGGESDAPL